jgi:energy-converting hydrogenase Eha subunit E
VEHHFHAAVLLVFEGLIEIGTLGEIRAAVGDARSEPMGMSLGLAPDTMGVSQPISDISEITAAARL